MIGLLCPLSLAAGIIDAHHHWLSVCQGSKLTPLCLCSKYFTHGFISPVFEEQLFSYSVRWLKLAKAWVRWIKPITSCFLFTITRKLDFMPCSVFHESHTASSHLCHSSSSPLFPSLVIYLLRVCFSVPRWLWANLIN